MRSAADAAGHGAGWSASQRVAGAQLSSAQLSVNLGPVETEPFTAAMDLTSGKERPLPATRDGRTVRLEYDDCPARTLVRVYWPLRRQ